MEEDLHETKKVEIMRLRSLKLYKCHKVGNKVDGQVLFIFRLLDFEHTGQPGPLTERTIYHHPKYTQVSSRSSWLSNLDDNEFLRIVYEVTSTADLFFYSETDEELAFDLARLIRSCYQFSVDVLSASSDYSLVFVVEVGRMYATKGFIEAKQMILLVDSTSGRESTAANDEEKDEQVIVDDYVDNRDELDYMGCEESSMGDEMDKDELKVDVDDDSDDCDNRSVLMEDNFVDNDTWEEEEEEEEEEEDDDDEEEKEAMKDIINKVRSWQELPNGFELILEEIKPLITYELLNWRRIGNDRVITEEEEKRGECAICLAPYTGKVGNDPVFTWCQEANAFLLARLGCGHSFHHRCLFEWLGKKQTCPLCRSVSYVTV